MKQTSAKAEGRAEFGHEETMAIAAENGRFSE
jgi:hypothetical protein